LIGVIDMEVERTGRAGRGVIALREMDRQVVAVSERVRLVWYEVVKPSLS